MTPGLAGFIASGDEQRTHDDVVAAALAALAREFIVVPEQGGGTGGASRRTWLDTFDWRLHRAGLVLEYVTARHGGELRLYRASRDAEGVADGRRAQAGPVQAGRAQAGRADRTMPGQPAYAAEVTGPPVAVQPVTGWRPARPHLLADFPDGPVTARIAGLLSQRAVLSMVTMVTVTDRYRLLNADGKTVARLVVDRFSIPGRAGAELAPRLAITDIRGYQGQARRAARLLAATPATEPATEPALATALRATGRRPGDYSNKVEADITATQSAAAAAVAILIRLLDTAEANVPGVLADIDTEFLHDLRVAVRRTRSALKIFGDVLLVDPESHAAGAAWLTPEELAFFAAEFKWVGDLTTPTRDLDVHLLGFAQTAAGLTAAKPDDLEPLRGYLEQRRRKEYRVLDRGLRSARFTALTQNWRDRLVGITRVSAEGNGVTPVRLGGSVRAATGTAGFLAAERTRVVFGKVAKRGAAITQNSPAEALHDLRKRCKELRYALEFFAPLHDRTASAAVVGDLKRLQDCLGEFQDTEVQIAEIRALATAMLAAGEAPAVTLLAMGEVTAGLAARQRAARADFGRRFAAFAGDAGRRRMSALLRGAGGVPKGPEVRPHK